MPSGLKIAGVTANCGNDTMGPAAAKEIVNVLSSEQADVMIINCQEVHKAKQMSEFLAACKPPEDYAVVASDLMVTVTKMDSHVMALNTGIATFVLYKKSAVQEAAFDPLEKVEVRGKNRNKGGLLNTLVLTDNDNQSYQIKTISGHLDSNSDLNRASDWKKLKQNTAFTASTWNELQQKTPDMQMAGYDANTRDLWNKSSGRSSMWHQQGALDARIANMALAPFGSELYSADNTYNTAKAEKKGIKEDSKRKGYAKAGSLDFVATQNNTQTPEINHTPGKRFTDAPLNLGQEESSERDHNVIAGQASTLEKVSPFERVRNYVAAGLIHAAPTFSRQISAMSDSQTNQDLLLAIHQAYLSPKGVLIKQIKLEEPTTNQSIQPWFEHHALETFISKHQESRKRAFEEAFAPQRSFRFSNKTQYIAPLREMNAAYASYIEQLSKTKSPEDLVILDKLQSDLNTTINQFYNVTKDPKKITYIDQFKASLNTLHSCAVLDLQSSTNESNIGFVLPDPMSDKNSNYSLDSASSTRSESVTEEEFFSDDCSSVSSNDERSVTSIRVQSMRDHLQRLRAAEQVDSLEVNEEQEHLQRPPEADTEQSLDTSEEQTYKM